MEFVWKLIKDGENILEKQLDVPEIKPREKIKLSLAGFPQKLNKQTDYIVEIQTTVYRNFIIKLCACI